MTSNLVIDKATEKCRTVKE